LTEVAVSGARRVAGTLRELNLADWTPLDHAIPELAAVVAKRSAAASAKNAAAASERPTGGITDSSVIPPSRGDWIC
jgi:hypothetical protein